jgi:hypothetical protein
MRRNLKKKQNSYDGQIVKQSDGVYDVVIPKIITPPRSFNPLMIENIRNVGAILEESPPTNRAMKPKDNTPNPRVNFLSLSEFTMTFSENDANVEKTLKNIELTPEQFSALKTIPGLEFRGIPLDQGSRRYCQRNEIQFDVLVSGQILTRYQCMKAQDVVKNLLHLFQLETTSTLVPTVPTGFNGTNANLTGYMAMMTQNPQSVQQPQQNIPFAYSQQPQQNPQSVQQPQQKQNTPFGYSQQQIPQMETNDFTKLLAAKEAKAIANKTQATLRQPLASQTTTDPNLVRKRQKEFELNTDFQKWKTVIHNLYRYVNPLQPSLFKEFIDKPLAISGFSALVKYVTEALSQTKTLLPLIGGQNTEKTPLPKISFTEESWIDEINLQEPKDILYVKIHSFQSFLKNFLVLILPTFNGIKNATFQSLKTVLSENCTEGYACFEYFRSGGVSIKTISLIDLLVILRSYTCNVMNSINKNDIKIDATTICNLENRMQFTRDLFNYLVGAQYQIPNNSIEFCSMLLGFLNDVTLQGQDSWLLYSFEEVKELTKQHANVFKAVKKLITDTNYTINDFDILRTGIPNREMRSDYAHFILVCILLQVCGILTSSQLLVWLNEKTLHNRGKLERKTSQISRPGIVSRAVSKVGNLLYSAAVPQEEEFEEEFVG